ncbi:MAG: hypothetical protein H7125_04375 [Proteobacteria bacterium]|nr:hypothetical protein [Burkholderiales bacterium]
MNHLQKLLVIAVTAASCGSAMAQSAADFAERDANQQRRILQGLQSGQLTTEEAARLERSDARIDRVEARSLSDGRLDSREQARIDTLQDRQSREIREQRRDGDTANPRSASSQRMQADVQRNLNQEARIAQGLRSGDLTNREAARLERGQAHSGREQFRAGRDGFVGVYEQRQVQRTEQRQSRHIAAARHDGWHSPRSHERHHAR